MDNWSAIEQLPGNVSSIASGVAEANRTFARAALIDWRARGSGLPSCWVLRKAGIRLATYITIRQRNVRFQFLRTDHPEEVVLRLDLGFDIGPLDRKPVVSPVRLEAVFPRFYETDLTSRQQRCLLGALNRPIKKREEVLFLRIGLFLMAIDHPGDEERAMVAWMWHGAEKANVIYRRTSPTTVRYSPVPFLMLLEQIRKWAASGYQTGVVKPIEDAGGQDEDEHAVRRIIKAALNGWKEASSALSLASESSAEGLMPLMGVHGYKAEVVIRLRPDGRLAEKKHEDAFRLRLTLEMADGGRARLAVGPPDFLLSGPLHDRLTALLLDDTVKRRVFNSTGLRNTERREFDQFLRASIQSALVFRAEKSGRTDTDLFVLQDRWKGEQRTLIAALKVRVSGTGEELHIRALDEPGSMVAVYTDLRPRPLQDRPMFPKYLITLIGQLANWRRALEGR